jgi:hypothetical protein
LKACFGKCDADPHHIDADPDPVFHFDEDPDPDLEHWFTKLYFHRFTINASLRFSFCKMKWSSVFKKIFLLNKTILVGETEI